MCVRVCARMGGVCTCVCVRMGGVCTCVCVRMRGVCTCVCEDCRCIDVCVRMGGVWTRIRGGCARIGGWWTLIAFPSLPKDFLLGVRLSGLLFYPWAGGATQHKH